MEEEKIISTYRYLAHMLTSESALDEKNAVYEICRVNLFESKEFGENLRILQEEVTNAYGEGRGSLAALAKSSLALQGRFSEILLERVRQRIYVSLESRDEDKARDAIKAAVYLNSQLGPKCAPLSKGAFSILEKILIES